ncbi:unnamed protein product, partial [Mesorhabditis belari]|uniref:protein disulfide-isomerase n=1 Tax=Mesorhabditis belari TaxID=2138241 RepID=A0AAF3F893_9BILA
MPITQKHNSKRKTSSKNYGKKFKYSLLPVELQNAIFSHIETEESLNLVQTNKRFRKYFLDNGPFPKRIQQIDLLFEENIYSGDNRLVKFAASADVAVIGYFETLDSVKANVFRDLVTQIPDLQSGITVEKSVKKLLKLDGEGVILFKNFDEGKSVFEDEFTSEALRFWIQANRRPLVGHYSEKARSRLFGSIRFCKNQSPIQSRRQTIQRKDWFRLRGHRHRRQRPDYRLLRTHAKRFSDPSDRFF